MKIPIKYKDQIIQIIIDENQNLRMFKKQLQTQTRVPVIQQEIFYKVGNKKMVLSDYDLPIRQINLPQDAQLSLKNLGKQIMWHYVFYIQYLGPILIFPLFYLLGDKQNYTQIQCWALLMAVLHYLKRQYQTAYVHVFSRQSMPFKRVFINCLHYWVLFALFNSIELFVFPSTRTRSPWVIYLLFTCWCVFEFCNYKCHSILASFRRIKEKADTDANISKKRCIPYGWGFNIISCANYFWEALGWITFSLLTGCWTSYLFTLFSIYQMTQWAIKKHRAYQKEFGDKYPKGRKAIFPFII